MALTLSERDRRVDLVRKKMRDNGLLALVVSGSTSRKGHFQYLTNYNIPIDYCYMVLPLDADPTLFVFTPNQARIAPKRSWVADARTIKSNEEIELIRQSGVLADGACAAGRGAAREGAMDYEVFAEMDYFLKRHGIIEAFNLAAADTLPAFPYLPVGNVLKSGEAVLMEITPRCQGYYAQLTTGAIVGTPNPEREKMVKVANEALEKGIEILHPGTRASDIDAAMRAVVERAGYTMPQRAGHGVGLDVDEPPALIPSNQTLLQPGMSVVVHPSVVIPETGGVFMGGTFLITAEGHEKLFRADLI